MTAVDWPAVGQPSPKDALAAALQNSERSEAMRIITASADFRDAAQCVLPVLRLARDDQALIDAVAKQALALFRGGWLQNRQLPSLLFCLRVAGQDAWSKRFCRRAVERAQQTGDWSDFEKLVEWYVTSSAAEEHPVQVGFSRANLDAIWDRLSETARDRIETRPADHAEPERARTQPRPEEDDAPPQEAHEEFDHGGISASSIPEALAVATGGFAAVGSGVTTRSRITSPAPAQPAKTPVDQLRAIAARPLQEMRAKVAARLDSLPASSPERAELERELARIDKAIETLP